MIEFFKKIVYAGVTILMLAGILFVFGSLSDEVEPTLSQSPDYQAISNEKYEWWFERNKDHKQGGGEAHVDLKKYDAYYHKEGLDKKRMYLTFDCGYENGYTEEILDILKKHQVKATFFVTKCYVESSPDIVKRMKEEGHMVGNHTCNHKSLPTLSVSEAKKEIKDLEVIMKEKTGYEFDPYLRPPKGEYSERTLKLCKDLHYKTIFWDMAYYDYDVNNQPSVSHVVEHFNTYHHPGAIALLHNISSANARALDEILENLSNEGYEFGTLDEL